LTLQAGSTIPNTKYRLFGVTCHRGAELRYGHYTAYVRSPGGKWHQADDEDMSPVSLGAIKSDKTAYLLSYIRLPDGQDEPDGQVHANGHANGNEDEGPGWVRSGNAKSNGVPQIVGKRKRIEEDELLEAKRPIAANGNTPQKVSSKSDSTREPIRKNASTQSTSLFPSSLDESPGTSFRNAPPSPRSDKTDDDDGPSRFSAFGAAIGSQAKSIHAPRAIPAGSFYSKSPIPRTSGPGPGSPRGPRGKKGGRRERSGGNNNPYHMPGDLGGKGFGAKSKGVYGRMQGRS
jgi:ubiquitin carboxyl-terminal hydrolase 36/42